MKAEHVFTLMTIPDDIIGKKLKSEKANFQNNKIIICKLKFKFGSIMSFSTLSTFRLKLCFSDAN